MASGKSVLVVALLVVAGGGYAAKKYYVDQPPAKEVQALAETFPMRSGEDPADDAEIYVDPNDPTKSLIVATDRNHGLVVYDLKGNELDFLELGEVENIELRAKAKFGDREVTLVATADAKSHKILLFELATEKPYLRPLPGGAFETDIQAQGLALYRNPANGEISVYMIGRERDPAREAKEKLQNLKEKRLAAALGDIPLPAATTDVAEKADKTDKTDKKKKKKADDESAGAAEDAVADAAKAAEKAERKTKRNEAKAKEKTEKSINEKPTAEEEALAEIANQPKKKNRGRFAVQMKLATDPTGSVVATENRRLHLEDECEGAFVDDELGALYISEEEVGVWKFNADGPKDQVEVGQLICKVEFPNPLRKDVEGIGLYARPDGSGYLIICSQGSEDFVVLDRKKPHDYIGRFKIAARDAVDAVENCDSITITSANLGGAFADGLIVVQDDTNLNAAGGKEMQNFKLVPWSEIEASFGR
jgi:myo-inositol-hexaphosphate 3-phosphohydrolase